MLNGQHWSSSPRQSTQMSPRSITTLLSSTLFVLQTYEVHPSIVVQAIAQCFYYVAAELFNRILQAKKLLCRSKALQVRMNLCSLEVMIKVVKFSSGFFWGKMTQKGVLIEILARTMLQLSLFFTYRIGLDITIFQAIFFLIPPHSFNFSNSFNVLLNFLIWLNSLTFSRNLTNSIQCN